VSVDVLSEEPLFPVFEVPDLVVPDVGPWVSLLLLSLLLAALLLAGPALFC
jgi:hypothetical protein